MFVSHYGVGFALKKAEPRLSLGLLIFCAVTLDFLFAIFLFTGLEHARIIPGVTVVSPFEFFDYPISHSAVGAAVWAMVGFLAYWLWPSGDRASRRRPALILAVAIFSHFILDVISHTPDMPLMGNDSYKLGLSLWNSLAATAAVELGILFVGVVLYRQATHRASLSGRYGLIFLVLLLVVLQISSFLSPPPPSMTAVAIMLIAGQLAFVVLAFRVDRKRSTESKKKGVSKQAI